MDIYRKVQKVYNNSIRDSLPKKNRSLAGVHVRDTPLFDLHADNPRYKIGLILALYDYVSPGDQVEIVGFGRGVTTTHMFWAGASQVIGYEGAMSMIEKGVETVKRNCVTTPSLTVKHSIVGDPIDVYGNFSDAKIISPSELADSDILVLDCEGAEKSILTDLGNHPETVICETHPTKGAPAEKIVELLEDQYVVSTRSHKPQRDAKEIVIGTRDSEGQ
jgi:hypothetical protein